MDNKKSAASAANTGDTKENGDMLNTDIIAQAIAEGKGAVWFKRHGWTISPQLPKEEGNYLLVEYCQNETGEPVLDRYGKPLMYFNTTEIHSWNTEKDMDVKFSNCVCWLRLPDITDWQRQLVPNQTGMTVE